MNKLYIDTSDHEQISVRLEKGDEKFEKIVARERKSQVVLELIEHLLEESNLKLTDIDALFVKEGPGSYTGLKVGASIANALSFALQIPVNELPVGEWVKPRY